MMRIDNQTLWLFANSMATCLSAGLLPKKALETSGARSPSRTLRQAIGIALQRCDRGMQISDALAPSAGVFPRYFLPVLRAGEASGRLVEAFQLLSDHCHRIGPSVRLVRNTWLYPLICVVFGWIIRTGVFLYFGRIDAARHFVCLTFGTGLALALTGWVLLKMQPVRRCMDLVLLQIPIIRETWIRLAVVLFFATFRLSYEAGGLGVLRIFDLAWDTVGSHAIRQDLLKARGILAENGTFGDAFEQVTVLGDEMKGLINTGAISGQLDRSLNQIVETATQQLDLTLQIFNQFFQRLVAFSVSMSIVETVLICIL